ncbi:Sua5/YciO/YrdC/YwlC family protein [Paraglaciecola hydrolytica]|uniref:Threonylcarbamoyl-AMP synthase n=1 Tax=Paraglaciecola hydrolytica TaxID=1799789 RepID=A0A136A464_9ALTE|nr:Sua5/YciO/YrdC/YwlC family protein [Paraglaciecola hydrolytica]KXI30007.1 L-threonylcarbamoyladenylate synthase TsaC [Paraglaciecola hydrolytica]
MLDKSVAQQLQQQFVQGCIFAYPTEAVYGLGCDPDNESAVTELLRLKQRSVTKGLILVARSYSQFLAYVDDAAIPMDRRTEIFSSWPGPNTWLLPASKKAPLWITGGSDFIAVRVSQHPLIQELCELFQKPLVSTSANISTYPAAQTPEQVITQFADKVVLIAGELGGALKPSMIRHGYTGKVIREN